uniref:Ankyrin repeat domain 46b n=1 Tax=Hucho hucho TaxID=62062 RepID=A0A4W5MSF4_9TELE
FGTPKQACIDGDLPFAKRLLETGCDPNIRDNRGRTGLHLAAARGNVDICWFLHKFGADLLATDYQGNTALHLCGHVDTIQFLVSNGLKIDICNHNGSTPLVLAKRRGVNKDAIRLLEGLEEQEVKGFNRGAHSKLETMQMAESESVMESHSNLQYQSKVWTPTLSRVFLYFYYFLHCRIIVKTSNLIVKTSKQSTSAQHMWELLQDCWKVQWRATPCSTPTSRTVRGYCPVSGPPGRSL